MKDRQAQRTKLVANRRTGGACTIESQKVEKKHNNEEGEPGYTPLYTTAINMWEQFIQNPCL